MSFSGLATWCHPQPIHGSAHGISALIWSWCIPRRRGPTNGHQGCLAGFYFQSSVCGLLADFISLILAFSSATPSPVTVVCYQSDRDELRRRVIQWLEAEIIPDGWFSKGSNYSEVLDKYFKASRAPPASEAREHFCKAAAMPAPKRLQCVMGLSSWGSGWSGMSYSVVYYGLPAAAADRATDITM